MELNISLKNICTRLYITKSRIITEKIIITHTNILFSLLPTQKHTLTIELLSVLVRQVLRVVAQVPRHLPRLPGEDHQAGVDQRPGERGQQLI